jgi:hypothetical protein
VLLKLLHISSQAMRAEVAPATQRRCFSNKALLDSFSHEIMPPFHENIMLLPLKLTVAETPTIKSHPDPSITIMIHNNHKQS